MATAYETYREIYEATVGTLQNGSVSAVDALIAYVERFQGVDATYASSAFRDALNGVTRSPGDGCGYRADLAGEP